MEREYQDKVNIKSYWGRSLPGTTLLVKDRRYNAERNHH